MCRVSTPHIGISIQTIGWVPLNTKNATKTNNKLRFKSNSQVQSWFKGNLIFLYAKTVLWSFGLHLDHDFKVLVRRILRFYETEKSRKNIRMVFEYLKDCYTVVQFHRAGFAFQDFKHHVSLDKRGLPRIIPIELRNRMDNRACFLAVSSILALYRVMPWWPKVSLETILAPFEGLSKTFDVKILTKGKDNLCKLAGLRRGFRLKMLKSRALNIQTAGPNGKVSLDSSFIDGMALLSYPRVLLAVLGWNVLNKSWSILFQLITLLSVSFPFFLYVKYIKNQKLHLGRLSIVKDVAGKSRVVGITNYWIQVSLKPLHDSILELLKKVPTDGTYGQEEVITNLFKSQKEHCLYSSYDLSAATDRLPLEVQKDILSMFIGKMKSDLWAEILNIPFYYKGEYIKYSVGQPMGAYSSWAMLALTHHVLVASLFEKDEEMRYAVLGDDMAIIHTKGDMYVRLMTSLGVKISLSKSIIKSNYIEFAKKLFNMNTGELDAVLGPKLILNSIPNKLLKVTLLHDSYLRGIFTTSGLIEKLHKISKRKEDFMFGHYLLFGPWGLISKDRHSALSGVVNRQYWSDLPASTVFFSLYEALGQILLKRWKNNRSVGFRVLQSYFTVNSYSRVKGTALAVPLWAAFCLFLVSPGCWVPLSAYYRDFLASTPLSGKRGDNLEELLEELDLTPITSISKPSRKDLADMRAFYRTCSKEFERAVEFHLDCPF